MSINRKWLDEILNELTPEEVKDLASSMTLEAEAMRRKSGDETPDHLQGTPRDAAVQKLAALALKVLRVPGFGAKLLTRYEPPVSYDDIGEDWAGVSRERVRALFEELCPFEYENQRKARRAG